MLLQIKDFHEESLYEKLQDSKRICRQEHLTSVSSAREFISK